jgi:hypothetical protein
VVSKIHTSNITLILPVVFYEYLRTKCWRKNLHVRKRKLEVWGGREVEEPQSLKSPFNMVWTIKWPYYGPGVYRLEFDRPISGDFMWDSWWTIRNWRRSISENSPFPPDNYHSTTAPDSSSINQEREVGVNWVKLYLRGDRKISVSQGAQPVSAPPSGKVTFVRR